MAEDWGPFGNLGLSGKKIILLFFSVIKELKVVLKMFDMGGNGKLYERMLGCASDTYFYVGFPESTLPYFFLLASNNARNVRL